MIGLYHYLNGAIMTAYFGISVFFLRFSIRANDQLFRFFSLAFLMFGLEKLVFAYFGNPNSEEGALFYLIRLSGFLLIFIGIVNKNKRK